MCIARRGRVSGKLQQANDPVPPRDCRTAACACFTRGFTQEGYSVTEKEMHRAADGWLCPSGRLDQRPVSGHCGLRGVAALPLS